MMLSLSNDFLTVTFSENGATLTSIKDKEGIEYLWQGDANYWSGQAPVLFPNCGSVRDDKTIFASADHVEGTLPRHGLVRKKVFDVTHHDENSIAFSIQSTKEMLDNYPFAFELTILYTLSEKTITTTYQIKNKDSKQMPFFIGGHPGFNCPIKDGESYDDYYLEFEKVETLTIPKQFPETGLLDLLDRKDFLNQETILPLSFDLFKEDAITLDQLESRSVKLLSKNHDKGIEIAFKDFPALILWTTPNKGPFIALEPWLGLSTSLEESDVFEEKRHVQFAQPNELKSYSFDITVLG
ncbi:aldose 1-epimerase family protein [Streptococcus sp. CSL10205-OR2]|uniref:aldose 1-epimerase family protein n=1 Tax=Streptococcus sp. CSL10205-OR2 TaxID=2980558 RepID=UPI0021D968EC|nr:aldose 1-epimerase family protein [Streptococcus sp. CSL10205-OR2]MCU9534335.1 aldose 1-epimerase family protein [Streptococcus sp. CSL10205-OR2]